MASATGEPKDELLNRFHELYLPASTRSLIMLEVAAELVKQRSWPWQQAQVRMRAQGNREWSLSLTGSDSDHAIGRVASGETDVAIVNPAGPLTMAHRGKGEFSQALPVRTVAVLPSSDQMGFALAQHTGLRSLVEARDKRYPLKVSLRRADEHGTHMMARTVLASEGFSFQDVESWGGQIIYDGVLPQTRARIDRVISGETDAIFDEALGLWVGAALDAGMHLSPLSADSQRQLLDMGLRLALVPQAKYPKLGHDVTCLDFSGWPIFTRADVSDDIITAFCQALHARQGAIPLERAPTLPLARMCMDSPATPLDVPLHPAAERCWRELGYIPT